VDLTRIPARRTVHSTRIYSAECGGYFEQLSLILSTDVSGQPPTVTPPAA
jgi:hypothetical protein